jgi:ribonuclease ZC3H12
MPPDDPLVRNGPTLENFLRKSWSPADLPPHCPYEKKCTYGNKCKFYHVDRGTAPHKSVTDKLKEQSTRKILQVEMLYYSSFLSHFFKF